MPEYANNNTRNRNRLSPEMAEPPATIRVTVALNSNQSRKAPLVLNVAHAPKTKFNLVFKTAQSKLRLKKPTRIFVEGGKELKPNTGSNDWKFGNETTLLVSAGEDFVGVKKASKEHGKFLMTLLQAFHSHF